MTDRLKFSPSTRESDDKLRGVRMTRHISFFQISVTAAAGATAKRRALSLSLSLSHSGGVDVTKGFELTSRSTIKCPFRTCTASLNDKVSMTPRHEVHVTNEGGVGFLTRHR